jgi:hypothetical protein
MEEHQGHPLECAVCRNSERPKCPYCDHKLTGEFTDDGHTVCLYCGQSVWLGIGNYND